ncbi:hypothetical protein [Pseudomonas marginalis]|uniref:hypothetical protein n=1 Tax=Pseudomonas marginalis TaxID=298 RepID=UPI00247FB58E|nr:hypothetical protein [Pseudomonas marginalis]WGT27963.1 hypothetical protein QGQ83_30600 [Pseudomonas marginalis]
MYEKEKFNSAEKLFYRPLEAAIRWCELVDYEIQILATASENPGRLITAFPQWPCLHANVEKILDAVRNEELPYGALGVTVSPGTPVDPRLLTIRHSDLKRWMYIYHPDQLPSFLFGQSALIGESARHSTYLVLQADRDALQVQLKDTEAKLQALLEELKAAGLERDQLRELADNKQQLNDQSKASYLIVIGALVDLILGSTEAGRKHSIFESQASIVDSITSHHDGVKGLSKRSLDEKFAAGRRSLMQAKS